MSQYIVAVEDNVTCYVDHISFGPFDTLAKAKSALQTLKGSSYASRTKDFRIITVVPLSQVISSADK